MAVNNATCSICGTPYYMCQSCRDFKILYPYKLHTDTAEHYQIYQIIHGYSTGIYNKAEAKKKLQAVDLADLNTFRENIQTVIKDIMSADNTEDKIEDNVVDNDSIKSVKKKSSKIVKI